MNYKKITAVFLALGMTMMCFSGCGLTEESTPAPTTAPSPAATATAAPKATATPTPKATSTPKPSNTGSQNSSGSQSGSSSSSQTGNNSGNSSSGNEAEEEYETQYVSGNVMTNDDTSMTIETGADGNFYEMTFDISNAEVDIEANEVVGVSSLRTSLNVDVDYYVKDGVNIATYIHSDGIEYFSPSFLYEYEQQMQQNSQDYDDSSDYEEPQDSGEADDSRKDYVDEDVNSEADY